MASTWEPAGGGRREGGDVGARPPPPTGHFNSSDEVENLTHCCEYELLEYKVPEERNIRQEEQTRLYQTRAPEDQTRLHQNSVPEERNIRQEDQTS